MKVYMKNFGGRILIFILLIVIIITVTTLAAASLVDGEKPSFDQVLNRGPVSPSAPSPYTTDKGHTANGDIGNCPNHE
jgi:hypothetical protein